jgi:hypothetical protein
MLAALKGEGNRVPRESALMKIMKDNMKTMIDARPSRSISFLTTLWPTIAAKNARMVK